MTLVLLYYCLVCGTGVGNVQAFITMLIDDIEKSFGPPGVTRLRGARSGDVGLTIEIDSPHVLPRTKIRRDTCDAVIKIKKNQAAAPETREQQSRGGV